MHEHNYNIPVLVPVCSVPVCSVMVSCMVNNLNSNIIIIDCYKIHTPITISGLSIIISLICGVFYPCAILTSLQGMLKRTDIAGHCDLASLQALPHK